MTVWNAKLCTEYQAFAKVYHERYKTVSFDHCCSSQTPVESQIERKLNEIIPILNKREQIFP